MPSSEEIGPPLSPQQRVELAREQLAKVQTAWFEPTDWSDLTVYGMYAVENAVVAAAESVGIEVRRTHWDKVSIAQELQQTHGLPDIADLLQELNELRKGFSYGESVAEPTMAAEEVAAAVETYVEAAGVFVEGDSEE